jgi:glycosyltransferase involved in cell wall biosynthesis
MANAGVNAAAPQPRAAGRLTQTILLDPAQPAGTCEKGSKLDLSTYKIVALIPAYNEERFIGSVVLKARRYAQTVIVVDDGSTDATAQVAAAAGAVVFEHAANQGKGVALNTGLHLARDHAPDAVVMLDADGQHLPEELALVVAPVLEGRADLVIGSRYLERSSQVPRHRVWGHWFFNTLTRLASGTASTDSQSGYRAFSPAALETVSFSSNGFSVESEMQFIAHENCLRLVEVPITIQYTDKPKRPVLEHGLRVLNGVLRLTGQYRPLLFFGVPGLVLFFTGLGWGVVVVDRYSRYHQLAVGYALICVLMSVVGLIMSSTAITLHSIRGLLLDLLGDKTWRTDRFED